MDWCTLIGLVVVLYYTVYVILLAVVDCDLGLLYAIYFGSKLDKFKDKVVWITGASSGIGEHLAVELVKNGAKVVLTARSALNLDRVKSLCLEWAPTSDILVLPADITDLSKHEELFLRVINHFGKLDILVNNAGRSQRAVWEEIQMEVDREVFDLNVFSAVSLSRIAVNYFNKVGTGQLVVTSSIAGIVGAPYSGSYTATKHAIHGYFKTLRTEKLGKGISVTLLCPGATFSNFLSQSFTAVKGEKFGQDVDPRDRRLATARCAYLSAVAIINKLEEVWMGVFPLIPVTYIIVYFPNITKLLSRVVGPSQLMKLRDTRVTVAVK